MDETETPDLAAQFHAEASNWYERGRYDRALSAIQQGLRIDPAHIALRRLNATISYLEDRDAEARDLAHEILRDAPEDYGTRLLLAQAETALNHHSEAESILLELLRDYPDDADLLSEYAKLMLRTLHLDKARALAGEALRLEPDGRSPLVVATLCDIAAGKRLLDQRSLAELLEHHPTAQSTALMLISALLEAGKYADAQRVSSALVRADPRNRATLAAAKQIAYVQHWSMRPLWPVQRFGWGGVFALWMLIVVMVRVLPPPIVGPLSIIYLLYCLYSWVWPGLLRRWMFGKE
jgi:predicted Zn-dependent protease